MSKPKFKLTSKYLAKMSSIRTKMYFSYAVIVLFLLIPTILIAISSVTMSSRYNKIIYNINYARALTDTIEIEIDEKIWDIVAGKKTFDDVSPLETIEMLNEHLDFLSTNASSTENQENINVIKRTMKTLEMYTEILKNQINDEVSVAENINIFEELKSISSNIIDFISGFIMEEIQNASLVNESLQIAQSQIIWTASAIFIVTIMFVVFMVNSVTKSVRNPIKDLERFASEIAQGNFRYKVESSSLYDLRGLSDSLNIMSVRLEKFLEDRIEYQENIKKAELQILQAQITPHFLYNTLDTIVWLAEEEKHKEVINLTKALSDFFRISLSKGSDWITVEQEFKHARSYLMIQKIRYRDILKYEILEDEGLNNKGILKLILQPLIENALYHGIKETRKGGNIKVISERRPDHMYFEVSDDGVGMTVETLKMINDNFKKSADKIKDHYGLYNVNQRLVLYYGKKSSLKIESVKGQGTKVYFKAPLKTLDDNYNGLG